MAATEENVGEMVTVANDLTQVRVRVRARVRVYVTARVRVRSGSCGHNDERSDVPVAPPPLYLLPAIASVADPTTPPDTNIRSHASISRRIAEPPNDPPIRPRNRGSLPGAGYVAGSSRVYADARGAASIHGSQYQFQGAVVDVLRGRDSCWNGVLADPLHPHLLRGQAIRLKVPHDEDEKGASEEGGRDEAVVGEGLAER